MANKDERKIRHSGCFRGVKQGNNTAHEINASASTSTRTRIVRAEENRKQRFFCCMFVFAFDLAWLVRKFYVRKNFKVVVRQKPTRKQGFKRKLFVKVN